MEGKDYNEKCDLWSLGVIIYYFCFKELPFIGNSAKEIINNIKHDKLKESQDIMLDDLIKHLLKVNINDRLTWEEYFNHSFFKPYGDYKKYYHIEAKIRETTNATVYKAKEIRTEEYRAIKVYNKKLRGVDKDRIENEINYMELLEGKKKENKNTVKIYHHYENEVEYVIVMELCNDNLLDVIYYKKKIIFNSDEIYNMLIQLNESFKIMNEYKLIHCTLNIQNIFIKKEGINYIYKLKLTDDSIILNNSNIKCKIRDIPNFYAPEILKGE